MNVNWRTWPVGVRKFCILCTTVHQLGCYYCTQMRAYGHTHNYTVMHLVRVKWQPTAVCVLHLRERERERDCWCVFVCVCTCVLPSFYPEAGYCWCTLKSMCKHSLLLICVSGSLHKHTQSDAWTRARCWSFPYMHYYNFNAGTEKNKFPLLNMTCKCAVSPLCVSICSYYLPGLYFSPSFSTFKFSFRHIQFFPCCDEIPPELIQNITKANGSEDGRLMCIRN